MNREIYINNIMRQQWDGDTRTYTEWDETGQQTLQRPFTTEENAKADIIAAEEALQSNKSTIESQAETALSNNTAYLAIPMPTQAQAVAQVEALTRQVNKIIRLVLQNYEGTD